MNENLRFFHLLSVIERKHGLSELDAAARSILDLVIEREVNGQRTTAGDLIEAASISRASVYRKIGELKSRGCIKESWDDYQLVYSAGEGVAAIYEEISGAIGQPKVD